MYLLRMSCKCCALLGTAVPLLLLLSLLCCSGGTEAPAKHEEATQRGEYSFTTEKLSVNLEAVDQHQGSTALAVV